MYSVFLISTLLTIILMVHVISSHPIQPSPSSQPNGETSEEDLIQIDIFSQLVSSHWQFDHLDSLIGQSHKEIADRLQDRIHIDMKTSQVDNPQQQPIRLRSPTTEVMEYELLKSQMMNAIQARTQGMLPEMWDQVGGEALGRPKMERVVQNHLRSSCPASESNPDWITSSCLQTHLATLSNQLNEYVQTHLTQIWDQLHKESLPGLLDTTAKDLENLITYFNDNISQHHRIHLTVLPWSAFSNDAPPLLSFQDEGDDHSLFSSLISLAKV